MTVQVSARTSASPKGREARALRLCALAVVIGVTSPLHAAEVEWRAPPECADSHATIEEAERLLGRPLTSVAGLDFQVEIEQTADGRWRLNLTTLDRNTGEKRERLLEGKSCYEATAAAAVSLAMVVNAGDVNATNDESRVEATSPPSDALAAADRTPPPPSAPAMPSRPAPDTEAPRLRAALSLGVTGDVGAMSTIAPGGEVGVSLGYGSWRLTALGAMLVGPEHEVQQGKGAELSLKLAALLGCKLWAAGRVNPLVCLGAEVGQLSGTGVGVRNPRSGESWWWAARAEAGLLVPLSDDLVVLGRLGATFPQIRRDFVVDDAIVVNRPSAITGRALLGCELSLW